MLPGEKAKLVNFMDKRADETFKPLYSVELTLSKSPKLGVKCGAIVIFRMNNTSLDFDPKDPLKAKAQEAMNEQTTVMYRDPEYFKETEGRWIPWATRRLLEIFDELGTNADVAVKCAKLRISQHFPRSAIVNGRGDVRTLFRVLFDIDKLLDKNYNYDPWSRTIRRGRIGAAFHKERK